MQNNISRFLLAAPTSGTGKTTVSCLLMALLTLRGYKVQPYKCGPDYIDTKFHRRACGRDSYNLDLFMASAAHVLDVYSRAAVEADVCIVEGMMGLFDGYDRARGSSAEVAKTLDLPVVLAVNAKSAAYSLAALIKGYIEFDPEVKVTGVIFNKVGSDKHEMMLREVCADLNIDCYGCLRMTRELDCGSRYLGLDFNAGTMNAPGLLDKLAAQLDCDLLLQRTSCKIAACAYGDDKRASNTSVTSDSEVIGQMSEGKSHHAEKESNTKEDALPNAEEKLESEFTHLYTEKKSFTRECKHLHAEKKELRVSVSELYHTDKNSSLENGGMNIWVARNEESFSFLYAEHIDYLQRLGEVTFFDPEQDGMLPDDVDLLYLPGGYPENRTKELNRAKRMRQSIGRHINKGGCALAECGGMMYLSEHILTDDRKRPYRMVGVLSFDVSARKVDRRLSLGYRQFQLSGLSLRGHEFHYSRILDNQTKEAMPPSSVQVYDAKGNPVDTAVFRYKNLIASYTHLYWGEIDLLALFK